MHQIHKNRAGKPSENEEHWLMNSVQKRCSCQIRQISSLSPDVSSSLFMAVLLPDHEHQPLNSSRNVFIFLFK
jgi:hypothetical protein